LFFLLHYNGHSSSRFIAARQRFNVDFIAADHSRAALSFNPILVAVAER